MRQRARRRGLLRALAAQFQRGTCISLLLVLTFFGALCLGFFSVAKLRQLRMGVNVLLNPENAVRLAVDRYLHYFGMGQPIDSLDSSFANTMSIHTEIYHSKLSRHAGFPEEELWEEEYYAGDKPPADAEVARETDALLRQLDELIRRAHAVRPKQGSLAFASPVGHYGTLTKSLAKNRNQICPAIVNEHFESFDHRRRVLFVLGAQKGGTTYLYNALIKSKHFVGALHTYGYVGPIGLQSYGPVGTTPDDPKEVHFFNRFPQPKSPRREFLKSYPKSTWLLDKSSQEKANYTLLDATPDYLFNAMAPPRIKILFPQAKFVVLLRDPVARSLAEYLMAKKTFCGKQLQKYPNKDCGFPTFAEVIASELSGHQKTPGCLFNEPGGTLVWPECFKCSFTAVDASKCNPSDGTAPPEPCNAPPYTTVDIGNYAAQLSWWLSFFPADRFKFVLSKELHSKDIFKRVAVLNSIVDFVGLSTFTSFSASILQNVTGHEGPHPDEPATEADGKALLALRLVYRQSMLDLGTLFRHNHIKLAAVPEEFPLVKLKEFLPKDIVARSTGARASGGVAAALRKRPPTPHSVRAPPAGPTPLPGTPEYTDMKLDEIIERYNETPADGERFAFNQVVYGSLTRADGEYMCPEVADEAPYPVLSDKRKVLYLLGAQKSGTTYLFSALETHNNFVGAEHGFRQPRTEWAKEVHFFNRWPTPRNARTSYMSCFPRHTWMLSSNHSDYTLLDATPDYMFNAMAAPRIKEMVPQAKFVVVLRDPVTRAYSAYKMSQKMDCRMQNKTNPGVPCKFPSFAEVVIAESAARRTRNCLFDESGSGKMWVDCFRCQFSHLSKEHCPKNATASSGSTLPAPCTAPSFITLDVGNYAAQLSWWFSFFPPERFLILLSSDLQHADINVRVRVLNKIKSFATVAGPDFTAAALEGARGFGGGYDLSSVNAADLKALLALRLIYRQSLVDLRLLLWKDGRHQDFAGVTEELTAAGLQSRVAETQPAGSGQGGEGTSADGQLAAAPPSIEAVAQPSSSGQGGEGASAGGPLAADPPSSEAAAQPSSSGQGGEGASAGGPLTADPPSSEAAAQPASSEQGGEGASAGVPLTAAPPSTEADAQSASIDRGDEGTSAGGPLAAAAPGVNGTGAVRLRHGD